MKRVLVVAALALALVGCAPALVPTIERVEDAVTVTVLATAPAYNVTLSVLNVTSTDERCGPIGDDIGCVLGDLAEGEAAVVNATVNTDSLDDAAYCVAFGFTSPDESISSYRPFQCSVVEAQ